MRPKHSILCLFLLSFVLSCSKSDISNNDSCSGVQFNISHTHTESIGTVNNGTITLLSPRGDSISYKLNNGSFQDSWYFNDLAPGNYVVTIKNLKGCTDTANITILNYGPKYAAVKQLIVGYCGPCHLGPGHDGNKNFDSDLSIILNWDRIKIRAVDNTPTQMPELPNAPLTAPDKQKIVDWVNAGHHISD
jgi:hypothetical protein